MKWGAIVIRFDGALTGNAKGYYVKRLMGKASIFGFLASLFNIPFWGWLFSVIGKAKYGIPLVIVLCALFPLLIKLLVPQKSKERANIRKVIIKDDIITIISEESSTQKKLKVLKKSAITANFMNWCFLQLTFYLFAYVRKVYFLRVVSKNLKSFLLIN